MTAEEEKSLVLDDGKVEKLDFVTSPPDNLTEIDKKFPKSVGFIIGNEFCER